MIRRSVTGDQDWIRRLAAEVYADLGDYGAILPSWLGHPGVLAYVDSCNNTGVRRGFVLLGFYEPRDDRPGIGAAYVADLLAIAVEPRFQGQGIGKRLLTYAIHIAELAARSNRVSEIRLTVADGNRVGKRLYLKTGFEILDEDHGAYDGGQRAIRMVRRI